MWSFRFAVGGLMGKLTNVTSWWRRLRRRLALPSMLMGLVVFSFTLLGFGAAVYTAALPSLVAVASHDDGAFAQLSSAVGSVASPEGLEGAAEAIAGETEAVARTASLSLAGIGDIAAPALEDATDDVIDDAPEADTPEETTPPDPAPDTPTTPPAEDEEPDEPAPDPGPTEEQLAYREQVVAMYNDLPGYVERVNACTQAFNDDCLADLSTRLAHQRTCEALDQELFGRWSDLNMMPSIPNNPYSSAKGEVTAMYRLLATYLGCVYNAWTVNVQYEEPSGHVEEFMVPLAGAQEHLEEFRTRYEGFEL